MSDYSMPVLSEQEREDLIGLAMIEVKRWKCADGKQYMVELMNIALAALTAKPRSIFTCSGCGHEMLDEHTSSCDCGSQNYIKSKVFTTPPVPVIKQEGEHRD